MTQRNINYQKKFAKEISFRRRKAEYTTLIKVTEPKWIKKNSREYFLICVRSEWISWRVWNIIDVTPVNRHISRCRERVDLDRSNRRTREGTSASNIINGRVCEYDA